MKRSSEDYPALLRPIIFVCNEGFARPFYPLRDICLRQKILSCSTERIQERLDEILRKEGYRTNVVNYALDKTISQVIAQGNGDLRNIMNTVQFLATTDQLTKQESLKVDSQCKNKSENLFNIAEYVMFDKPDRNQFETLKQVRNMVNALAGDTKQINESLYENFS